jgi:hypothetical protein
MEFVHRLMGEAWEHRRRRHQTIGIVLVLAAIMVGAIYAGRSDQSSRQPFGSAFRSEPAAAVFAYHGLAYPLSAPTPITTCKASAPQNASCEPFLFSVVLKRPATSVAVSFDGLTAELKQSRVKPGTTIGGVKVSPGTLFTGLLPTVRLETASIPPRARTAPPIRHQGDATFRTVVNFGDGHEVSTKFRYHLRKGWL